MKHVKIAISFILSVVLLFATVSCGLVYISNEEDEAFESMLSKLFEALDAGDAVAIYELFSPVTREQFDNLQEQIAALISVYTGPTDEFYFDGLLHVGEHIGESGKTASADTTIPARSGDNYFFFYIDLTFEHYDEKQLGITQLEFFTADEMCAFIESEDKLIGREGLYLHSEKNLGCEIRTISGDPLRYTPTNYAINIDEVKEFLKSSSSFSEFVERFGEANAKSPRVNYYYYELPKEKGEPRYLCIREHDEVIRSATIEDDFAVIEMVWDID